MSTTLEADALPPCRILVRSKQTLELFTLDGTGDKVTLLDKCATTIPTCTASDGSVTYVHVTGVGIVQCNLQQPAKQPVIDAFFVDTANVQMMHLSGSGSYLLTWERWYADKCVQNLKLWSTATGKLLASFSQKSVSRESWPYLQWTADEAYAFLLVSSSQVRVYEASDLANNGSATAGEEPRFTDKLQVPCTTLSLRQVGGSDIETTASYYFTTFSAKQKDKPAVAAVHEYSTDKHFVKIATKSLF